MANSPTTRLTTEALAFLTERHLAMLTTLRDDNTPHVVAVGFTFDPKTHIARVITSGGSQKAVNAPTGRHRRAEPGGRRAVAVAGGPGQRQRRNARGARRRAPLRAALPHPQGEPDRVVIEVHIERVLGSSDLLDRG